MPVYEYVCEKCHATTEMIRTMNDADAPVACERCGHSKTQRIHSVFMARGGDRQGQLSLPTAPCGRCGDPQGTCGV